MDAFRFFNSLKSSGISFEENLKKIFEVLIKSSVSYSQLSYSSLSEGDLKKSSSSY